MGVLENFLLILLTPLLGAAFLFLFTGKLGKNAVGITAFGLAAAAFLASLGLALRLPVIKTISIIAPWINVLGVTFSFYYDTLTAVSILISTFITAVALIYAVGYFRDRQDFNASGFYSLIMLFLAGIIGVFVSSNLILFYFFWELMLLPTFAIVAYFGENRARSGVLAIKYFIFTHIGAVLILFASLLIYAMTGTADMSVLKAVLGVSDPFMVKAASVMLILGFGIKLAVVPFHSWLPDTYENAPTPATVIMASVMMNASIYGLVRFFFTVLPREAVTPFILPVMVFAVISQFYGAILALVQKNIKRMIAYSSISQMGYVLFGIGTLTYLGVSGAVFHMVNHTIIKALLFMTVGAVYLSSKSYDTDELGGLTAYLPLVALTGTVGALAVSGIPLFGAFQSEWLIFAGGFRTPYTVLSVLAVAGALFTAAYALKFVADVFFGARKNIGSRSAAPVPRAMVFSMSVLASFTLLIGIYPWFFSKAVHIAVRMLGV